jgi:arginase family enzyme
MIQIGIRGTTYDGEDRAFAAANGIRIVPIEEFRARGVADVMAEARDILGRPARLPVLRHRRDRPRAGARHRHARDRRLHHLRGAADAAGARWRGHCRGDLVEVSPPFDPSGMTAWIGASILFEIFCVTAAATARTRAGRAGDLRGAPRAEGAVMAHGYETGRLNLPFVGICTFGKSPYQPDWSAIDADVAILGAPFDFGTQWRAGARFGPRAVREASTLFSFGHAGAYDHEDDVTYLEGVRMVDLGDADIVHTDTRRATPTSKPVSARSSRRGRFRS